ncbi:MAG: TRAP transporter substrate-binding protein [Rubrivivax sp.]|nr:TRAP transporter substrate-binding protein [Rubrivivax sp.]
MSPTFRLAGSCWLRALLLAALSWNGTAPAAAAGPDGPAPATALRIVGGLAGVNQYTRHEEPFWSRELARLSGGRFRAEIVPFDRAGLRAPDMLTLVKHGSVPFGTLLLAVAAPQDPELAGPDLPGLNPDAPALQRTAATWRPLLEELLRERHGVELLALYTYPAQVLFCKEGWRTLGDLKGRRIRTSSRPMSDWVEALGAQPVATGFAEILPNLRAGNVDCAITGTMSGNSIGLHEATSHVHAMAIAWGLSAFVANGAAWRAQPEELRRLLQRELPRLEHAIWDESMRETAEGLACNTGAPGCAGGKRGRMALVDVTAADLARSREIFHTTVLPRWQQRCGAGCERLWQRAATAAAHAVATKAN